MAAAASKTGFRPLLSCYHCNETLFQNINSCGNCDSAFYCNEDHYLKDWDFHKKFCKKQPHEYSAITNFWTSMVKLTPASSQPNNSAATPTAANEKESDSFQIEDTTKQFHIIKYDDTTHALESITAKKMNDFLPIMIPHVAQRLSKLRPDQVLFVTNRWGPIVVNYDGLFIYRLVPEGEFQAKISSTPTESAKAKK